MKNVITGILLGLTIVGCSKQENPPVSDSDRPVTTLEAKSATVTSLNFGDVAYDKTVLLSVTILNNGTEVLSGTPSITSSVVGAFSIPYVQTTSCDSLAVGKTCLIKISLNAKLLSAGAKTETLSYASLSFPVSANILSVPTGTSSGGSVAESIIPSTLVVNFGVMIPKASVMKTVTIKNTSTIALTKTISLPAPFTKPYDSCSGKSIAPGSSCIIKIYLASSAVIGGGSVDEIMTYGTLTPAVQLVAQVQADSQSAQTSDVDAFFNAVEFNSTLGAANLGTLEQGKNYLHTFSLKNQGSGSATVSSVIFSSPLNIVYNSCSGLTLLAGKSCTIKTYTSPTSQGSGLSLSVNLGFETRVYPVRFTFQPVVNCSTDAQPCEISLMDGAALKLYKRIYTKQQLLNALTLDPVLGKMDLVNNIILESDINMAPANSGENSLTDRSYLARFLKGHLRGNNKKILNWKGYSFIYKINYDAKVTDLTFQNSAVSEDLSLTDEDEYAYKIEPSTGGYCTATDTCLYWYEDGYYVGTLASINEGLVDNVDVNGGTVDQPTGNYGSSGGLIGWQSEAWDNLNNYNLIGGPGIIKNSQVSNVAVNSGIWAGGIVGYNSGPIDNVTFSGSVFARAGRAGGIVGESVTVDFHVIKNATNNGNISGNGLIGGIAGNLTSAGAIEFIHFNLNNYGTITSTNSLAGGLFGRVVATSGAILRINDSNNYGDVIGTNYVGGIAGEMAGARGLNLHNEGDISGVAVHRYYIGGIVGSSNFSRYEYVDNTGNIVGDSYLGGIIGSIHGGQLDYAVSSGNVTASASGIENQGAYAGGIIGYVGGRFGGPVGVSHSSSSGVISAVNMVGGAFGWIDEHSVSYLVNVDTTANVVKTGAGDYGGAFAGVIVDDLNVGKTLSGDPNSLTRVPDVVFNIRNWADIQVLGCSATGSLNGVIEGSPGHKWIGGNLTYAIPIN